jgi:hypothetical protein
MSFCIDSGFAEHNAISAPSAFSAMTSTDVSFVMWRHIPSLIPSNGNAFDMEKSLIMRSIILILVFAHSWDFRPSNTKLDLEDLSVNL